jgi:hypothetical protein
VDSAIRALRQFSAQCSANVVPGPSGLVLFAGAAMRAPVLLRCHPRGTTVQLCVQPPARFVLISL